MKRDSFHLARRLALVIGSVALAAPWSAAAVAQESIKVGIIAPMSGPFGGYGQKFLNSAKAYQTIHGASVAGRKVELVVRPQPGHAVTLGENERSPSAWSSSQAAWTSSRLSPPGRGVSDTRIVSPMSSARSTDIADADQTRPLSPIPASVRPRCSG